MQNILLILHPNVTSALDTSEVTRASELERLMAIRKFPSFFPLLHQKRMVSGMRPPMMTGLMIGPSNEQEITIRSRFVLLFHLRVEELQNHGGEV